MPEIETDEAGNTIYRPEYVYDVEIKFVNTDNEDGAIDMFDTLLVNGKELMLRADEYLWDEMYPQLAIVFVPPAHEYRKGLSYSVCC